MNSNNQQHPIDTLGQELKAEAIHSSPAFSLTLHQRIMRNLKSDPAERAMPETRVFWWPLGLAAVAASLVIVILLGRLWMQGDQGDQGPEKKSIEISLGSSLDAIVQSTEPIQQQMKEARFGYVDQDARRLGQFVMNQLDVFPSSRGKDRGI